ncbi:helix-turn-helix domain-containing protein [Roseibacterium sp. SDUM158016]|uniref:helix-turn-helix domain-containing protein n=1 Tax=Roseicyclus sediminis TaxID=2980997 RepID=UPI0021D308C6|nr:helix-turn-helix transcriptional regulator [Roseibacterium sp. SDUM158016]MCU4653334.1 helix-turn-helix domain-containing protein [Roseibacterium sp. SDUM158016]
MWNERRFEERHRIARRLRKLRLERGLTQTELCARLGYAHPSSISSIEKGRRPVYRSDLLRFAEALDCDLDDLLGAPGRRLKGYPLERAVRMMGIALMLLGTQAGFGTALAEEAVLELGPADGVSGLAEGTDGDRGRPPGLRIPIESDNCDAPPTRPGLNVGS